MVGIDVTNFGSVMGAVTGESRVGFPELQVHAATEPFSRQRAFSCVAPSGATTVLTQIGHPPATKPGTMRGKTAI